MPTPNKFTLLYANKAYVTFADVRKIIQASVFMADQILIPSSIRVHPSLDDNEKKLVTSKVAELHEIDAIRFWEVEGHNAIIERAGGENLARREGILVIPMEVYNRLYQEMMERSVQQRQVFFKEKESESYDGLTEIVLGKQELWRFALSDYLGADRILLEESSISTMQRFFTDLLRYEQFESKIIEKLAEKLDLPDVSQFDTIDIVQCRRYMPSFRSRLLKETEGHFHELMLSTLIERIAGAIFEEYYDHLERIARESRNYARVLAEEIMWDILSYIFSPSVALKYAKLFLEWQQTSKEITYQPLLMELRRKAKKK